MLDSLLGSVSGGRVLRYLQVHQVGYAREIARTFDAPLTPIQKQLEKLEVIGVLESRILGRTRLYTFNSAYPLLKELRILLSRALQFDPLDDSTPTDVRSAFVDIIFD